MVANARSGELAIRRDIEYGDGEKFAAKLDELGDVDEIHLAINCHGGSVFEALSIAHQLNTHPAYVVITIEGIAASAASYLATAGDEIEIAEGGLFMIHRASTGSIGNAEDMRKTADLLEKIDQEISGMYARRTGTSPRDWLEAMRLESWFNSEELASIGLASVIPSKRAPQATTARAMRRPAARTAATSAIVNRLLATSTPRRQAAPRSVTEQLSALARRAAEVSARERTDARLLNRENIVRNADDREQALRYLKWS